MAPFQFNNEVYQAIYPGWREAEARADWNLHGQQKWKDYQNRINPPAKTAEQYADELIKTQQDQIKRETEYLEQYVKDNPFVFDEELARKSATEEYSPYYTELLKDYVADLDTQRATTRDEVKLLGTLKELDMGARTRSYDLAVNKAQEGFAGQGMFFSGIKERTEGLQEVENKADVAGAEARYGAQERGLTRQLEGYDVSQERKTRDLGREEQYAIEGGILQRKQEKETQYRVPLEQSYYRQFPSSSGGALKGYTVPEYFRY